MPYITPAQRDELLTRPSATPGELNYTITLELLRPSPDESAIMQMIMVYLAGKKPSYELYNSVMGVLECAYREYQHRMGRLALYQRAEVIQAVQTSLYDDVIYPFEVGKRHENGDVYPHGTIRQ